MERRAPTDGSGRSYAATRARCAGALFFDPAAFVTNTAVSVTHTVLFVTNTAELQLFSIQIRKETQHVVELVNILLKPFRIIFVARAQGFTRGEGEGEGGRPAQK